MIKTSKLVTQTGNDTFTSAAISTGLTADGKAGWSIAAIEAYWVDGTAVAAADWSISALLGTISTVTTFGDVDEIARISWAMQNTGGVAIAVPLEIQKQVVLLEPRITVQPTIYAAVSSAATGQANDIIISVFYDLVKLTDLEVLRLLAGGA
jgi:hypothetical protein